MIICVLIAAIKTDLLLTNLMKKAIKKVKSHLKDDIKMFKHEIAEDRSLIKKLNGKKKSKPRDHAKRSKGKR